MGNVAISMKVMPASPEVDLEKLRETISGLVELQDYKIEPLAFGLKVLKILVVVPDKGGASEIEKKIKNIDGVENVEVENITLI